AWVRLKNHITLDGEVLNEALAVLGDVLNLAAPGMLKSPIAPLPAAGGKQRIALCLGHARSGDEGVDSIDMTSEEEYNFKIIGRVGAALTARGYNVKEVTQYEGLGYTAAMKWLASYLLGNQVTAAVEFHFNASAGQARGHEVLHWNESKRGVTLAAALLAAFDQAFPEHPSRGLKPHASGDRGALFLSLTHCPAVIMEPFFGDNAEEWALFSSEAGEERLVNAYVAGIAEWVESQNAIA
ncbi:MAG: N-acetylmuramoyl-L-alanine amidase, partial [Luteolibacter sp.]